jgi:rhodanese-related sulfurtransferase
MSLINKTHIKEIIIIVLVSAAMAVLYNLLRTEDSLPFFQTNKDELLVNDDELFQSVDTTEKQNTTIDTGLIIAADTTENDTLATSTTEIDTITPTKDTTKVADTTIDYTKLFANAKKSAYGDFKLVTLQQVERIVKDGKMAKNFVIVDARRPDEYAKNHIGNAINIFPGNEQDIVVEQIFNLPKDKTIIIYCDGGNCDLSHELAALLQDFGYDRFFVFEGGWEEWSKSNK